ncbi:hypothetical protein Pedsa_0230 [Pseudopedobacter saltans DSM 12145]|uniref:Uncharacterized protein n=1 Tax=Pseudopedobacter saltans (strain ATCC 51119 / DSM 12145 / JCM 21818 / CCUG 39354 / LMG 10337 / NBRC 100064 / NCIMB 13643) TaxID=762903 RepID=F0SEF1_PSESL|nr:hypothetical protein [Pseudopedobacter saltans]ADY50816.1 hypothetical protein Pedsa_0230 [Pseudopedobacter saltans DSM 12145]
MKTRYMMETSTIDNGSVEKDIKGNFMENITDLEKDFYKKISPNLDELIKSPSEETISRILDYSRSL